MICHHCRKEVATERFVARTDECPNCGEDLHCCLNCDNYDPAESNKCREPLTEWVSDREKANFCDYFTPAKKVLVERRGAASTDEVKKAFDSLFKR